MKTFEQQTADAIRNLTIICVGLAAALVAAIVLAGFGLADASTASSRAQALSLELKASVQSPTHGHDIAVWCGFDQAIEADLLAYIGQFHGHVPALKLPSLDCAAIEAGEAAAH